MDQPEEVKAYGSPSKDPVVISINLNGKDEPAHPEPKGVAKDEEVEPEGDKAANEGNASV